MVNSLQVQLGQRIRRLRRQRGLTQVELAVHLGLTRPHVARIERGDYDVHLSTLQTIARGLGVSMSRLLARL
jgi:transcriptional regulator with XRE-family HTH domain